MTTGTIEKETKDNTSKLPNGWESVELEKIADINPRLPDNDYQSNMEVSFIPMKAVEAISGKYDLSEIRKFEEVKKGFTPFINEDIIFAKITPCMENGKMAILQGLKNDIGFGSTEFHVIRPLISELSREYIFYYLIQDKYRYTAKTYMTGAVGQKRVPTNYLKNSVIPLAPLNEQYRIVNKVEELFTELDKGVKYLNHLKIQLKKYRQSVLKHAFSGELTKEWREANKDKLEPASALLENVKLEKERLIKEKRIKKEPPLPLIDKSEINYEIPPEWTWCRLGNVSEFINGDRGKNYPNKNEYVNQGIPWINTGHIDENGTLSQTRMNYITKVKFDSLRSGKIKSGDLVYCLRGATFGKTAFVDPLSEGAIASSLMIIRPFKTINRKYLYNFLISFEGKNQLYRFDNGSAQPNLSASNVKLYVFPLPSLQEQEVIIQEIERHFSIADKIEQVIENSSKQADRLRQSILKQAFEGKLVPQDSTDEPASVLLERIKAEKEASKSKKVKV